MFKAAGERKARTVWVVAVVNVALLTMIGATFYIQDYRYSLPTPRPSNFQSQKLGAEIQIPGADGRPTLLCFASSDCGCSRFNQDHLWELSRKFGRTVRIVEIIEGTDKKGLDSPSETLLDPEAKWAKACGVFSTPQAVILDRNGRIAFSGNFNVGRFCADAQTQFARIALEAVAQGKPVPPMPAVATTPYGCAIMALERSK
jgi:hypothetical protein